MEVSILCITQNEKLIDRLQDESGQFKRFSLFFSFWENELNIDEIKHITEWEKLPDLILWGLPYDENKNHKILCELMVLFPEIPVFFWEQTGRQPIFSNFLSLDSEFSGSDLKEKIYDTLNRDESFQKEYVFKHFLYYCPLENNNPGFNCVIKNSCCHFYLINGNGIILYYQKGRFADFPGGNLPIGRHFSESTEKSFIDVISSLLEIGCKDELSIKQDWVTNQNAYGNVVEVSLNYCSDDLYYLILENKIDGFCHEDVFREFEKTKVYGELASGISSRMLNQLVSLESYSVLLENLIENSRGKEYLGRIREGTRNLQELAEKLFTYSRMEEKEWDIFDLRVLLEESLTIFEAGANTGAGIIKDLTDEICSISGIKSLLRNCFLNLFLNASEAMDDKGLLSVHLYRKNKSFIVEIHDSGSGMDQETIEQIFDSFFSTKKETGMGLPFVKGAMEIHNGKINVKSQPGRGTTINLELPEYSEENSPGSAIDSENPCEKELSIMIIDDEPVIRETLKIMLEAAEFSVIDFPDGSGGINYYRENKDNTDLVILDILMPVMGGKEVFYALKKIDPDVKVLLLSGFSEDGDVQEMMNAGAVSYLQKPVGFSEIVAEIEKVSIQHKKSKKEYSQSAETEITRMKEQSSLKVKQALDRLNGNLSLYFKLCRDFRDRFGNAAFELKDKLDRNKQKEAIIFVHSLKSLAATLGAEHVRQVALLLEGSLKEERQEKLPALLDELKKAYNEVEEEIENLAAASVEDEENIKNERNIGNDNLWHDYYHRIRDVVEAGEPNEAMEMINHLMNFSWHDRSRDETLQILSDYIRDFRMEKALEFMQTD